jgi:hypothetical protein
LEEKNRGGLLLITCGSQFQDLQDDNDISFIQNAIVEYIEHALPSIIANLDLSQLKSANQLRLEEFQIQGRPGFRRLSKKVRDSKITKLKHEYLLDDFQKIQTQIKTNQVRNTNSTKNYTMENISGNRNLLETDISKKEEGIEKGSVTFPIHTITPQNEKEMLEKWSMETSDELSSAGIIFPQNVFDIEDITGSLSLSELMTPKNMGEDDEQANELISLLEEWNDDESDYDEKTWPIIKEALEKDRNSNRRLFNG